MICKLVRLSHQIGLPYVLWLSQDVPRGRGCRVLLLLKDPAHLSSLPGNLGLLTHVLALELSLIVLWELICRLLLILIIFGVRTFLGSHLIVGLYRHSLAGLKLWTDHSLLLVLLVLLRLLLLLG